MFYFNIKLPHSSTIYIIDPQFKIIIYLRPCDLSRKKIVGNIISLMIKYFLFYMYIFFLVKYNANTLVDCLIASVK